MGQGTGLHFVTSYGDDPCSGVDGLHPGLRCLAGEALEVVFAFHHVLTNRSVLLFPGISLKTQILFLIVFCSRYLDVFTNTRILYNVIMKVCVAVYFSKHFFVCAFVTLIADLVHCWFRHNSLLDWMALQQGLR